MGVCSFLYSLIALLVWRTLLFNAFHYSYHFIDTLENKIGDKLAETLSDRLSTRMETLIDKHNPLASIALYVADKIGKVFVAVVVYAGARIGMYLVEKMEVKPSVTIKNSVVTIKESVVDPIKEFVSEKRVEYDDVVKRCVVAPIGDYALQKIKKFLLAVRGPFSLLDGILMVLVELILLNMLYKFLGGYQILFEHARFTVSAPIGKYVPKPFIVVVVVVVVASCFKVIIWIQKFVQMSTKRVQTRMLAVLQDMLALVAVLRVEYSIRDVKNFGDQIGHLRNTRELVHWLVDFAKEKSELIQVNQWLTSVTEFIDKSRDLHGFDQAENIYVSRPTNTDNFYHNFCPKKVVVFLRKLSQKFA